MDNENQVQGQTSNENQNTLQSTTTEPTTPNASGLADGLDPANNDTQTQNLIPDGFDEEIFDTKTMSLKQDKVKERLDKFKAENESYKKQALDLRRKLSKGVEVPDSQEKYKEEYVYDAKYDSVMEGDNNVSKFLNSTLNDIDKLAFDTGMTTQQAKAVKDNFFKLMENVSIIDSRTPEQIEKDKTTYIAKQKEILGDDADTIIKDNMKFIVDYGFFNKDEKEIFKKLVNESATGNTIVMKLRKLFGEKITSIPTNGSMEDGAKSDYEFAKEYYDKNTSDTRREEIIRTRIKLGRTNPLPTL